MKDGFWMQIGAIWGFLAVAVGAFGAHGLKDRLEVLGQTANFQTATHYHMYCALARAGRGRSCAGGPVGDGRRGFRLVAPVRLRHLLRNPLRDGSHRRRWLGAITPIGGVLMLVGWAALAVAAGGGGMARNH